MVKWTCKKCGFSAKLWNGDGGDILPDWWQRQLSSRHRFSKRWQVVDVKNIAGDGQATVMVDQNSANITYTFRFYVCLCLQDRDCCSAADGNGSCHGLTPSFFEEMTHCRNQKLHCRWSGNPNGWSKLRNLRLFTLRYRN